MSCSHNVDRPFECRTRESAARVIFEITSRTAFIRTKFNLRRSDHRNTRTDVLFPLPRDFARKPAENLSLPLSLSLLSLSLSLGILRTKVTPRCPARAWIRTRARVHRVCANDHNAVDRSVGRSIVLATDMHSTGITQHHHRRAPDHPGVNNSEARESLRSLSAPLFGGVYRSVRGTRDSSQHLAKRVVPCASSRTPWTTASRLVCLRLSLSLSLRSSFPPCPIGS